MKCQKCNKDILSGSSFCQYCGIPVNASILFFCQYCGNKIKQDDLFCSSCGKANAYRPAPQSPRDKAQKQYPAKPLQKNNKILKLALFIGLPVIMAAALLIFFISIPQSVSTVIGLDGGSVKLDGAEISYDKNSVGDTANVTLSEMRPQGKMPFEAKTNTYKFTSTGSADIPITLRLKLKDSSDDENLKICLMQEQSLSDGTVISCSHVFIDAEVEDGYLVSTFVPSDYIFSEETDNIFFKTNSLDSTMIPTEYVSSDKNERLTLLKRSEANINNLALKPVALKRTLTGYQFTCNAAQIEAFYLNGQFKLIIPKAPAGSPSLSKSEANDLLDFMETQYDYFLQIGYKYSKRTNWPFNITLLFLSEGEHAAYTEGQRLGMGRNPDRGYIELNRQDLKGGYYNNQKTIKTSLIHEWFHFVQANYTNQERQKCWVDEATATFFETHIYKEAPEYFNTFWSNNLNGIFPPYKVSVNMDLNIYQDNQRDGYARSALINYMDAVYGKHQKENDFILDIYEQSASNPLVYAEELMIKLAANRAQLAEAYYKYILGGCKYDVALNIPAGPFSVNCNWNAATLWGNITTSKYKAGQMGTLMPLALTEAAVREINAGRSAEISSVLLPKFGYPYGAKLIAFKFENDFAKPLGTDDALQISIGSKGLLRSFLYVIKTGQYQIIQDNSGAIIIPKIKDQIKNNYRFLLMVVSQSEDTAEVNIKAAIEPGAKQPQQTKASKVSYTDVIGINTEQAVKMFGKASVATYAGSQGGTYMQYHPFRLFFNASGVCEEISVSEDTESNPCPISVCGLKFGMSGDEVKRIMAAEGFTEVKSSVESLDSDVFSKGSYQIGISYFLDSVNGFTVLAK